MTKRIDKNLKRFPRVSSFITSEEVYNHLFIEIQRTLKKKKSRKSKKLAGLIVSYEAYFIQSVNFFLYDLNDRLTVHVDLISRLQRVTEPFHVDQDIASLDDNLLVQALSTLKSKNPTQYKVFLLKALEDMEYSEIAQKLNLSTDNVRQIYCRARNQLRDFLSDPQHT